VERIAAAREAADAHGSGFVLTARTDALALKAPAPLSDAIQRANRYRQAGADCLFGFRVDDRFYAATLTQVNGLNRASSILATHPANPPSTIMAVGTTDENGNGKEAMFDLIIY
jgi:2-methylisocitrate lyase-like PEP mutase family enzyme